MTQKTFAVGDYVFVWAAKSQKPEENSYVYRIIKITPEHYYLEQYEPWEGGGCSMQPRRSYGEEHFQKISMAEAFIRRMKNWRTM